MLKRIVCILLPLVYLLILLFQFEKALTQDLGRHIKLGEIILECQCVPKTNLFSYTEPQQPFVNHHWGSEVIFYLLYAQGGMNLILFAKIIILTVSFGIVYAVSLKRAGVLWSTLFSIPLITIFSERFDARPEIFSFLFVSIFLLLIYRYKNKGFDTWLFLLPVLEIIWVNMHIYFIVGVALVAILLTDEIVNKKSRFDRRIAFVAVLTILATFINPNFITGALFPLTVFKEYGYSIVENQSPLFLIQVLPTIRIVLFEFLTVLVLALLFFARRQIGIFSILSVLFVLVLSFKQIRSFPLFVLVSFPVLSYGAFLVEKKLLVDKSLRIVIRGFVIIFIGILGVTQVLSVVRSPFFGMKAMDTGEKGVTFMQKEGVKGPLFNNFNIGSYLIFRLYPKEKVFVDGRPEAYSVEFFKDYIRMQEDPVFFQEQVEKYNINTVLFSHGDITPWAQTFLLSIIQNDEWKTVYLDEYSIILVRNNPENQAIIKRFGKK